MPTPLQPDDHGGQANDLAERSDHPYRLILDGMGEGVATISASGVIVYANPYLGRLVGRPEDELAGTPVLGLTMGSDRAVFRHLLEVGRSGSSRGELELTAANGTTVPVLLAVSSFEMDERFLRCIVVTDMTERRDADRRLAVARQELLLLATRDPLTGLANRIGVLSEITRAQHAGRRSGCSTGVLMVDLDRFKAVNDSMGHLVGDRLLKVAASRIQASVRGGDLAARLGGDEFVIVMRDLDDPTEAVRAAWRLVEEFRRPFAIGDTELHATVSIGVAVTSDSKQADDLMREADTALYVAKDEGRDRVSVFDDDLRAAVSSRLEIEDEFRNALASDQLVVWYQPEIDLMTGSVIAVEALLRWHNPDGELWTADRFIEVAEETGLILDIGAWVLREACTQAAIWATDFPDRTLMVRVNLSALQLTETSLLVALDQALASTGVDPALLCMEITETALLRETSTVQHNLAGLRERGIRVAIDDFGTGYASLACLRDYPTGVIKIDRGFVSTITTDGYDRRLLAGIVALAQRLGMTITAEGVERQSQADLLRDLGCDGAQGFLYSEAVPSDDIEALLESSFPHP